MKREFELFGKIWKTTSWKRNDESTFSAEFGRCKITVTNGHIHYGGKFIFHCFAVGFDTVELPEATTHEEAAEMAVLKVAARVREMAAEFSFLPTV